MFLCPYDEDFLRSFLWEKRNGNLFYLGFFFNEFSLIFFVLCVCFESQQSFFSLFGFFVAVYLSVCYDPFFVFAFWFLFLYSFGLGENGV